VSVSTAEITRYQVSECGYGCPFCATGDMDGSWCAIDGDHCITWGAPPDGCPLRHALRFEVELVREVEQ
jgi:hypothetical protein